MSSSRPGLLSGIVLVMCAIALACFYLIRTSPEGFGCESDMVLWKSHSSGDPTDIFLTTLFLFNSKNVVTIVHKGVLNDAGKHFLIDRNYTLTVERVEGSSIFYVKNKKLNKSEDDVAPDNVVNDMLTQDVTFFYITRIDKRTWIINGPLLPIMMCVAIPAP